MAATEGHGAAVRRGRLAHFSLRAIAERWSLVIAFVGAFVFFSIARPDTFPTWDNARAILDQSSVLCVLAVGVTVVLVIGEFDLSIGFVTQLTAAAAVSVMAFHAWPAWAAVLVALLAGVVAGLANGIAVAHARIPSFVATLALGSIAGAIELAITKTTIFEGLDPDYLEIATTTVLDIPLRAIIAAGVAVLFMVLLRMTVYGRHAASVGDNATAARLAGVPVERVQVIAFVLTGLDSRPRGHPGHVFGEPVLPQPRPGVPSAGVCGCVPRSLTGRRAAIQRPRELPRCAPPGDGDDRTDDDEPALLDGGTRPGACADRRGRGDCGTKARCPWPLRKGGRGSRPSG